jgi:hypothetical protein
MSTPGVGIHSYRMFGVAIVDVILTAIAAIIISRDHAGIVFIILVFLSIPIHTMLKIRTKTNSWLLPATT